MKKTIIILNILMFFMLTAAPRAEAQTDALRMAPGAKEQLANLLNKPAFVTPVKATSTGKGWFTVETDIHIFTQEASVRQIAETFLDFENQDKVFIGKKSRLRASRVSSKENEHIVDFDSVSIFLGIHVNAPYQAAVIINTFTDTKAVILYNQTPNDNDTNKRMKNMMTPKYIEEVTINGKKYTYIRLYSIMDVNASILPGNSLEKTVKAANEEALPLIIAAAKIR